MKNIDIKNDEITEIAEGISVIKFWAPWCPSCITYAPVVESALEKTDLLLANCNVDENPKLRQLADIKLLPSILVLKDGEEIHRFTGSKPEKELKDFFEELK